LWAAVYLCAGHKQKGLTNQAQGKVSVSHLGTFALLNVSIRAVFYFTLLSKIYILNVDIYKCRYMTRK